MVTTKYMGKFNLSFDDSTSYVAILDLGLKEWSQEIFWKNEIYKKNKNIKPKHFINKTKKRNYLKC